MTYYVFTQLQLHASGYYNWLVVTGRCFLEHVAQPMPT